MFDFIFLSSPKLSDSFPLGLLVLCLCIFLIIFLLSQVIQEVYMPTRSFSIIFRTPITLTFCHQVVTLNFNMLEFGEISFFYFEEHAVSFVLKYRTQIDVTFSYILNISFFKRCL